MKGSQNKNLNSNKVILIVVLLMVAVVGYYCYLVTRSNDTAAEPDLTAVDNVLLRDMQRNYPPTPKEVIKYYNEIMKCYYNEECTQEEIDDLAMRARELYDDELVVNNPWGTYIIALTAEIDVFREKGNKLTSCSVAASTDVDYFEEDGYSFARISCGYTVMQGKESYPSMTVYLLRKDDKGHWRIYGWDLAENVNVGQ